VAGFLFAGNRHRQAAWDQRGMDVVAGQRRQNLAPRPGKEMGGGRTRSRGRPTAEERTLERRAKAVERRLGDLAKKANGATDTAEQLREQAKNETDRGARRRLSNAAKRAERDAKKYSDQIETAQENLADSWKRR
jgi:hypothetical protein